MNNLKMLVTCDHNNIITVNNINPWNINDNLIKILKFIKGNIIIIGRKTYEKISKKYLKNSITIILSRIKNNIEKSLYYENTYIVNSKESLFYLLSNFDKYHDFRYNNFNNYNKLNDYEIYVIGGEEIYKLLIENTSTIFITQIISNIIIKENTYNKNYNYEKKYYNKSIDIILNNTNNIDNIDNIDIKNITKFDIDMSQFELIKESKLFLTENNGLFYEFLLYSRKK